MRPTPLGHARVYRDPRSGDLLVDTDSLRRTRFAGVDVGAYDEEDDDFGQFDDEEEEDDDFGRDPARRRRRRRRRLERKRRRLDKRTGRKSDRLDRKEDRWFGDADDPDDDPDWGQTAVNARETLAQAGPVTVQVRLQHDFRAEDISFKGSSEGTTVRSVLFGDRLVWSSATGIPTEVFENRLRLKGFLDGQSLRAGLDIVINGEVSDPNGGTFSATLLGLKPVTAQC